MAERLTCAVCGAIEDSASTPGLEHIVPRASSGAATQDNLLLLCAKCHAALSRTPREIEFVRFLADALISHPHYTDVRWESVLQAGNQRFRVDIIAERKTDGREETLVIECKTPQALATTPISHAITQLQTYRTLIGKGRMVLAVPASISASDLSALRSSRIETWDLAYLVDNFSRQAKRAPAGYYKALLLAQRARRTQADRARGLIDDMRACRAGRDDWRLYQSIVGEVIEWLFTPPLNKSIVELSDTARANRRDFILPNYANAGFWAFMRAMYKADYIVIDAKNSARPVKKADVLQMANYLKPHGTGLFGIVVCRGERQEAGCLHTVRDQWQQHGKLILILCDADIEAMLMARSDGRPVEDIVSRKIDELRLSM